MPEVANPAVIIGLGGTGKWVVTYLKKSLLDTYDGKVPSTIRLLSFDTTSENASKNGESKEEDVRVGDTQLEPGSEFIYLGGNIYDICRDIRDKNGYPHIGSWLQAKDYLSSTNPDAFDISGGAGQKRPFGRMSVFYDLQQNIQSKIFNKITSAIDEVISANQQKTTVEIYVVASLAGGTGAGMFIDIAHLARWFASKRIRSGFAIRGFLALQNTFNTVINTNQVQPNAFAAMRELDRFMLVFDKRYPIVYNANNPELDTIYGGQLGKLFDSCYLLDASRDTAPLDGVAPKYGMYPSIADAITTLLDGSTGETFTQHYVNVANRIGLVQKELNEPIYSSLGTFKLIIPIEDIITSLTYRFAQDILANYLLNIETVDSGTGQVKLSLRYDGNAKKDAEAFLRMPKSANNIASTNFIQRVPNIVDNHDLNNQAYISEVGQLAANELLTWIIPPESDPTVEALANKVRTDLEIKLATKVQPSDIANDDPIEGCGRIVRQTSAFKEEFLGIDQGGRKLGGVYQQALEHCRNIHRDRYRALLNEFLLKLLNGSAPDNIAYQHEKRGRLGQAQAILSHLSISYFTELIQFLDRIKTYRSKEGLLHSAQENASVVRGEMQEKANRGSFLGQFFRGLHPAVKAQHEYLEAEQAAIDVEINDLFFEYLRQTAITLRQETELFKSAVDTWINTLLYGITGQQTDLGLYRSLEQQRIAHQAQREEKEKRFKLVREYLTDTKYEDGLYAQQTQGKAAEVLSQMIWSLEEQNGQVSLKLSGFVSSNAPVYAGKTPTERNLKTITELSNRYFAPLRNSVTIADRLAEHDPLRLMRRLRDACSALVKFNHMRTGGNQEGAYFICVNEGNQRAFFGELRNELKQAGTSAREMQLIDASDRFTCTVLTTSDAFSSTGMHAYLTAERAYNVYTGNARLLHNFPAEVNAVAFEQKLPTISEPRRRFSALLTTMLENIVDVRRFMKAYLYRMVRLEAIDTHTNCWRLFVSEAQGRRNSGVYDLSRQETQPPLLQAMETFVFMKSAFDNSARPINFDQVEREINQVEQDATKNDDHRLVNLWEDLIDNDIIPMRNHTDQNMRDLGSLMQLLLNEMIEGVQSRISNRGERFDTERQPLINVRQRGTPSPTSNPPEQPATATVQPPPVVTQTVPATATVPPPPVITQTTPTTADTRVEALRGFYTMYQDGDLTAKVLIKKVGQQLEEGDIKGLKFYYDMYQEGDLTEEVFIKRLAKVLS